MLRRQRNQAMRELLLLEKKLTRTLIEIRKTLTRIRLGKYGTCEKCGQMIDTDRLAIKPTATACIKCEKKKKAQEL